LETPSLRFPQADIMEAVRGDIAEGNELLGKTAEMLGKTAENIQSNITDQKNLAASCLEGMSHHGRSAICVSPLLFSFATCYRTTSPLVCIVLLGPLPLHLPLMWPKALFPKRIEIDPSPRARNPQRPVLATVHAPHSTSQKEGGRRGQGEWLPLTLPSQWRHLLIAIMNSCIDII
jgi:hypothetical protein